VKWTKRLLQKFGKFLGQYKTKLLLYKEPGKHNLSEKGKSSDVSTKLNQMLELSGKDFKAAFIKNASARNYTLETNEKLRRSTRNILFKKNGNYDTDKTHQK
jgi:hypothetical protein